MNIFPKMATVFSPWHNGIRALCVYSDFQGWQNHQFTGRGEFALTFGNFKVQMTVPADHVIGATGECQNYAAVIISCTTGPLAKKRKGKQRAGGDSNT